MSQANSYSQDWFKFFHAGIAERRTNQEVDFICECAPLPPFRDVLDVCCGMWRHSRALTERGYVVTGVERDHVAIARAREFAVSANFIETDIRDYAPPPGAFDLVILMSQSFGYFDPPANRDLLKRLATGLRDNGRIILDLWNPDLFEVHQGGRDLQLPAGIVRETRQVKDGRLFVHLGYPDGAEEDFEWHLFTPEEMRSLAEAAAISVIVICTDFNPAAQPDGKNNPRLQCVLQRSRKS